MTKIIDINLIELELDLDNKESIIRHLAKIMDKNGRLNDIEQYIDSVMEREELVSTSVGHGVCIPHGKTDGVRIPSIAFARTKKKVEWGKGEEDKVNLIFMIAVPEKFASNDHLKILAALSRKLIDEDFRKRLTIINDKETLMQMLTEVF